MSDSVKLAIDLPADQKIQNVLQRLKDRRALHDAIGQALVTRIVLGFDASAGPYGKWKPLAHRRPRGQRQTDKPLIDTSRLRNSITHEFDGNGVRIGTNVEYAPFHQFGTQGLTQPRSRVQPTTRKGKFITKAKAGKRKSTVDVRFLKFGIGSGKIPARPFLPDKGLPATWEKEDVAETIEAFIQKGFDGT